jgi:hypothetical protein
VTSKIGGIFIWGDHKIGDMFLFYFTLFEKYNGYLILALADLGASMTHRDGGFTLNSSQGGWMAREWVCSAILWDCLGPSK